jgi:hypothetical protein
MTAEPSPVRQAQHRFLWRTAQVNQPRLTVENLSEYNVARTVARRAGASLLPAVRLSRRVDLLTRLIYVPLSDSRWGAQPRCRFCSILLTHVTYPLVLRRRSIQHRRNSTAGQLRGTTRRTRFQAWTDANPRGASVARAARRPPEGVPDEDHRGGTEDDRGVIGAIHHCAAAVRTVMGHQRLWIEFPCPAIGTLQLVPGPRRAGRSVAN